MTTPREPRGVPKRHAYEPPASLLRRPGFDPHMKRPLSTLAGGLLVMLSALAGAFFIAEVSLVWFTDTADDVIWMVGDELHDDRLDALLVFAIGGGILVLAEFLLAFLVIRGRNWPRVTVMTFSSLTMLYLCAFPSDKRARKKPQRIRVPTTGRLRDDAEAQANEEKRRCARSHNDRRPIR